MGTEKRRHSRLASDQMVLIEMADRHASGSLRTSRTAERASELPMLRVSGTVHDLPFGACAEVGSRRMALPSARRAAVHRGTAAFHGRTPEMLRPDQMSAHQQKYYDWTAGIERRGPWQDFDGDSIYPMPVLQGRARVDAKQGICGANYVNDEQGSGRPCRAAPPLESKTPVACAWLTPARSAARLSELRNWPTGNMPIWQH